MIVYTTVGTVIGGLTGGNEYYVTRIDKDRFSLSDTQTNFTRRKHINFTSAGVGYQNFSYKDITVTINAEYNNSSDSITVTPIVRGSIESVNLYENGTGYGSTVLNFHKRPNVSVEIGKDAELTPVISSGKISSVVIANAGTEYTSAPLLTVKGAGAGAKLRAVVSSGKITSVVIVNPGIGYGSDTTITVSPNGRNAILEASVRDLTVNKFSKFDTEIVIENPDNAQGLEYAYVGYSTSHRFWSHVQGIDFVCHSK